MIHKGLTIEEAVRIIIENNLGGLDKDWNLNYKLVDDCGADSLDLIEIIMAVEDEFGVEIPDEAAGKMVTGQDIVNYIREL